ncbi:ISP domain-containing protein [Rhizoclosmatium globosum]|uniref:ISP domain-containing protein n=1 Tax=Rhizoclosmatium globosum TaxID=329046 RepID=A0A1Y2CVH4_9FUNG|nr:ISP domain-containing protein [Rhizoclosmatium globosum]|eukprot:ORY51059.1 ISP domain-containing protein [Rhizoclosmatium globosum]
MSSKTVVQRSQDELETAYYSDTNTDMRNHWYPLILSTTLKPDAPQGYHILGDPIVMYRDPATNEAITLADKCPHRSAPLSVGRIMDGKLECRYHGWQFETNGVCSKVPSNPKIPANAKIRKYPTVESEGFVWSYSVREDWIPRIGVEVLDIDSSLLNENFLDPAHLPFTHEKTIGKRENATHMTMTCNFIDKTTEGHGIGIEGIASTPDRPDLKTLQKFQFFGPCLVALDFGDVGDQTFYSVPTRKGHCHFVYIQRFSFLQFLEKSFWGRWILDWYNPQYTHKILMEDYAMLKGQQDRLLAGANAMNSPVAADLMIKTYRNWWRKVMKHIFLEDNRSAKAKTSGSQGGRVIKKVKDA